MINSWGLTSFCDGMWTNWSCKLLTMYSIHCTLSFVVWFQSKFNQILISIRRIKLVLIWERKMEMTLTLSFEYFLCWIFFGFFSIADFDRGWQHVAVIVQIDKRNALTINFCTLCHSFVNFCLCKNVSSYQRAFYFYAEAQKNLAPTEGANFLIFF